MNMHVLPIKNQQNETKFAQITWQNGQPFSSQFNDVYFSSDNGLAETQYVFIEQNQLIKRFKALQTNQFTIAETGFGTGLSLLSTWKLWQEYAPPKATLHFISCEKYPITEQDLAKGHQQWPELSDLSGKLIEQYQININDTREITLDIENIKLTLLLDDASIALSQLNFNELKINAWFLDGFAPSKNPDMWTDNLFNQMARLSDENTTFATFTSASAVRQGLQKAGFTVNKLPGFGKKREMLAGKFNGHAHSK